MTAKVSKLTEAPTKPARQRLIDAGERLFAEHGWNGVGIRTITAAADVSLAALNYKFGEKENLLADIFAERAGSIAAERMQLLAEIKASDTVMLERSARHSAQGRRTGSVGRSSPNFAPGSRPSLRRSPGGSSLMLSTSPAATTLPRCIRYYPSFQQRI